MRVYVAKDPGRVKTARDVAKAHCSATPAVASLSASSSSSGRAGGVTADKTRGKNRSLSFWVGFIVNQKSKEVSKMETSLRYWGDSKSIRIHAKEKIPINSQTHFQVQGELDTKLGAPTLVHAMIRRFYPNLSASLGLGLQYEKNGKVRYTVRGKKAFRFKPEDPLAFVVKARSDVDQEFRQWKTRGGAEVTLCVINFQKDQDVRFKVGVEVSDQQPTRKEAREKQKPLQQLVPYLQIRENNWTLNADIGGKWNVRYDL